MFLTTEQLVIFKEDIESNTNEEVIAARNAGNNSAIAEWYSRINILDFWIFKRIVPLEEVSEVIELDDVANMTQGDNERLKTFFAIRQDGVFASKLTDRAGFDDIFKSSAGDMTQQALIDLWKRLATNMEKLFAVEPDEGEPGQGTNDDPAQSVIIGGASLQNVRDAVALP